jgi:hypothetical protein
LVGSEGKKSKVYSMPVPSEATPTPTPGPNPEGSEGDVPEEETNAIQSQQGTLLAIGVAAFVALVAGAVVVFVRNPS